MTYITRIKIDNLANQTGTIEWTLNRHTNVFWGLNGRGKTTLLKIVNQCLANSTQDLRTLPFTKATIEFYSENFDAAIRRSITRDALEPIGDEDFPDEDGTSTLASDILFEDEDATDEVGWKTELLNSSSYRSQADGRKFKHVYLPISRIVPGRPRLYSERRAVKKNRETTRYDSDFARDIMDAWALHSSRANIALRDAQREGLEAVLAAVFGDSQHPVETQLELDGESAFKLVSEFLTRETLTPEIDKTNFVLQFDSDYRTRAIAYEIEKVQKRIDKIQEPRSELQRIISDMYLGNKAIVLSEPFSNKFRGIEVQVDDTTIPLEQLSSGEKQILRILIETLDIEESLIMIDEPEISLHVDWQNQLVESMRIINPKAQLLLATHSPEIMANVQDHEIFEL